MTTYIKHPLIKKDSIESRLYQQVLAGDVLKKGNTMVVAPTALGKTIVAILVAADRLQKVKNSKILILSPSKPLAIQHEASFKEFLTLPCSSITGAVKTDERVKRWEESRIISATPQTVESDLLNGRYDLSSVSLIVFDESHTLLWSEDFRFTLSKIPEFLNNFKNRPPILALTATATSLTINKINSILNLKNPQLVVGDCDRKNIYYRVIRTDNKERILLSLLSKYKTKILIYCMTIKNCEYLYYQLLELGYNVRLYHGMMEKDDKIKSQNDFYYSKANIMIATNAFGMGIDIPDIRYVIEYDLPSSIEDYIQQVGRVSRDGKYGEGILLFDRRDISTNEYFIENIKNDNIDKKELNQIKLDRYQKLDKMIELALTAKCLHQFTSNYFGHKHPGKCMMCSNCKKQKPL